MIIKKSVDGKVELVKDDCIETYTGVTESDLYLVKQNLKNDPSYSLKILSKYPSFKIPKVKTK